ncbi:MAG: aspartate/glutamate racemase family protein [Anaerolineaceae bacterium]|nr:MAG: aspartate/glutamate racemase family protein [Anaerolineaceae bacterium]
MIGIVAGVGPYAGLDLLKKILSQTVASRDQDHLDIASLSQPEEIADRTAFLLGETTVNPAYAMTNQLLRLQKMGASVAGIPCNTAHAPAIFSRIQRGLEEAGSQIRLLNMIVEVGYALQRDTPAVNCIGVLSTLGTAVTAVYPSILEPLGFEVITPDKRLLEDAIQPAIYDPVYGIKACGYATKTARDKLMLGVQHLKEAGAQAIVLGCTEIPLAIRDKQVAGLIVVDPTLILARALIFAVNPQKLATQ